MDGSDRTPLGPQRYTGTILDWKGKFGWIAPTSPIDHPLAMKRGGKVYLSVADVEEELEGVGATVSFTAYADSSGLGAASVRPATGAEASAAAAGGGGGGSWVAGGGGGAWGGKGGKGGKGAQGGKGGKGGNGEDAMGDMAAAFAAMAKGMKGGGFGGFGGFGGMEAAMQSWGGGGSWGGNGGGWGRGGGRADPKDVPDKLHKALNNAVWKAANNVTNPDPEWTPTEMTKRIVKYFYKAGASPELLALPWPDAAQQYVENAMQGYSAACGDRPWFFELDLSQALCNGLWEIVRASSVPPRANYPEMEQVAMSKYEEVMDGILTDKAMYDAVAEVFGEESFSNKVYKTLKATHEASYNEASSQWRMGDQQRVEMFMGTWMENSMGRAWQSLDNSELQLNPDALTRLFTKLLAPFGEEHPFSCIPAALTQSCGRPPSGWPFIRATAEALYNSWVDPTSAPPTKKRKTGGKGGGAWGGGGGVWGSCGGWSKGGGSWQTAETGETDIVGAMLEAEAAAALV